MKSEPRRLMIYAHYDNENKIRGYTEYALKKAKEVCQDIILVTTSNLQQEEIQKVSSYLSAFYAKNNEGLDFGMWKLGIKQVNLQDWDELVLMNSSVYGPVFPLRDAFDSMEANNCDFWGMTDSYQHNRHLQSYFVVFRQKVISSSLFMDFWNGVLEYRNKNLIIMSYELGLSQWLNENGFKMGVYCPWSKLIRFSVAQYGEKVRHVTNPVVRFPGELLELKMPFLKREVMRDNPFDVDLDKVKSILKINGYPLDLIWEEARFNKDQIGSDPQHECPLCGAKGKKLYKRLKDRSVMDRNLIGLLPSWDVRRCSRSSCRSAWLDPRPHENEIWKAYQSYYTHAEEQNMECYYPPKYSPGKQKLLVVFNRVLEVLGLPKKREWFYYHGLKDAMPGRLLEVGCGGGGRLSGLKQAGWDAEGQDVDAKAVERCRSQGLKVYHGTLESCSLSKESYDVILISHVLEHLHDPVKLLKQCRELLRPSGRVVITTPNIKALGRLLYYKYWLSLDPPRHLVLFSQKSLRNALVAAGFSSIKVSTISYNMELTSMHSRDIRYDGFTDFNSVPRLGKELMPVFLQCCALILCAILPWLGEECFAKANK